MIKFFNSVLVLVIAASCFSACGVKGQSDSSKDQPQQDSLEAVKEIQTRVEEIYKDVFSYGEECDYDEKYMSSEYKKLLAKAMESDEEFWMGDHWTQSQDPNKPFMKILSVERTTDTSAIVQIMVSDSIHLTMGSWAKDVRLNLVKENGTWLIDDFITHSEGEELSEKAYLIEITGGVSSTTNSNAVIADYLKGKVYSGEYIFDAVLTDAALYKEKCVFRMKVEGDKVSIYDELNNVPLKGSINDEFKIEVGHDVGDDMHYFSLILTPNDRKGTEWYGEYQYTAWVKKVRLILKDVPYKPSNRKMAKKINDKDYSSSRNRDLSFNVGEVSFRLKYVEGGTFKMGATGEQRAYAEKEEFPAHTVTLHDYYIGETEVTQELWEEVMGYNPANTIGASLPIENVSWNDCRDFIRELNRQTGKTFRLPTEAEWEYAARGGVYSRQYLYSGSDIAEEVGWIKSNCGGRIHPAGTRRPNELGIYDMTGNVCEWCQDWIGDYSSISLTNPTGPRDGTARVGRGGGWCNSSARNRVSTRFAGKTTYRDYNLGFRIAM